MVWTGTRRFDDLLLDGRWKVEFFAGELEADADSAYPLVRLSELAQESRVTINPLDEPDRAFNYLGMENVESLTGELIRFAPRLGSGILSRSKMFTEGNVLYGRLRPYLNKVYLARGPVSEGICSGEFFVLVPDCDRIRPILLRYLLSSPFVVEYLARFQSGAALPRVPIKDLLALKVPVPPMEDQMVFESSLVAFEDRRAALQAELARVTSGALAALQQSLEDGRPHQLVQV
jgi:type I restriction enzyme S subunit